MEVIDKKSYTLYPLTSYTAGATKRNLYEKVPMTVKIDIDIPTPIDIPDQIMPLPYKFNLYELDELPTDQEFLFDTKEELIAKLEEWGFEWKDFAEKICFFPYNANENDPTYNRFARGWVKDISPVWSAWDNLGIGKSWRAKSGPLSLSADDQYYGQVNELITYPMQSVRSLRNIEIKQPIINRFALSNKPLEETKYIWVGPQLLKTDATTPGDEDVFSLYLNSSTIPDFGSARTGTGQGNSVAGYNTGITGPLERGRAGFAIPILFYVNNPAITNVNKIYGLIYFGYVQRNYDGAVSEQKYFIMSQAFAANIGSYDWYYIKNSTATSDINDASAKIDEFFNEASEWTDEDIDIEETDPYETIQESENGGGDGTLDWSSDEIEPTPDSPVNISGLLEPTSSGGLINLYRVDGVLQDDTEWLRYFRDFLFDDGLLSAMEKTNADIKSCIISLKALPYSVEATQNAYKVILGKYDTGSPWYPSAGAQVEAKKVTKQTQTLNLGSIEIKKFYGSYLDYAPHTKVQIFLPFIGVKELDTDEVMGKTLTLKYVCDNFTGLFTAHIYVDGQDLYNFNGSMAMELPISGIEYTNKLSGLLQTIGGAATTIGGVATAASGNPLGIAAAIGGIGAMAQGAAGYNQGSVYKTSNLGLDWGWLGCRQPHLIISSPRLAQPRHRNGIKGKATCRTVKVSDISGFNQFSDIHVDQVICSDTEKELIKKALMEGFIV